MKKSTGIKIIIIIIMILGIAFSISNFFPVEVKAEGPGIMGIWVDLPDGSFKCMDFGNECTVNMRAPY